MNKRDTAGRLGFIKDSEGVYRKGNFVYKNGRVIRESQIVPEGTIKDLKDDDFITLDECIRSILAYSTTIGDTNPRATNVYIDKIGNSYKPAKSLSKNTVAVVMSNRQVMELKPRYVLDQDDNSKLKNKDKEDKPIKVKTIKDFSKPTEFDKLKKESAGKRQFIVKTKNYESDPITANSESEAIETFATQDDGDYSKFFVATPVGDIKESATKKVNKLKLKEAEVDTLRAYVEDIVYNLFQGTDFFVNDVNFNVENGKLTFNVSALGGYDEETGASEEYNREVEIDLTDALFTGVENAINDWKKQHSSPDTFYESKKGNK